MGRYSANKAIVIIILTFMVLSIVMAILGIFPIKTDNIQSNEIIRDSFNLTQNQIRRQGLGAFKEQEKITISVECARSFSKNFSIVTYAGVLYQNNTAHNLTYSFTTKQDYYESIIQSNSPQSQKVLLTVTIQQAEVLYPFASLTQPAKLLFPVTVAVLCLLLLKQTFPKRNPIDSIKQCLPVISQANRRIILSFVIASFILWIVLVAVNTNPLATFENWYTDHARHSYTASLFLKEGFSVFSQPLDVLASRDSSAFKFVTWPEMPHLYPIGSIIIFLPFGILLQNGFSPNLIYKLEIILFLFFAHLCLYFFLKILLKRDIGISWRLLGFYIIYVVLIVYAADGMFDSIAFIFSLLAITMFLKERYDNFVLLSAISILFKYQAGIFLMPIIIIGIIRLLQQEKLNQILKNKITITAFTLGLISVSTAILSAPYLLQTRPQIILNGINAFSPNAQILWSVQSFSVVLTFIITLLYAFYMQGRNWVLSISALFMLIPSFTLPYFQNWYLPFIFIYILIPQRKKDIQLTMIWLIFLMAVLSFGASAFNPIQIIDNFRITFGI